MNRFEFPTGSLGRVFLLNGYSVSSETGGDTVSYERLSSLLDAILEAVVLKPRRLSGEDISYLRDRVDFLQSELANLLGVDVQTISLWERDRHKVPLTCDVLFRKHVVESLASRFSKSTRKIKVGEWSALAKGDGGVDILCKFTGDSWQTAYEPSPTVFRMTPVFQTIQIPAQGDARRGGNWLSDDTTMSPDMYISHYSDHVVDSSQQEQPEKFHFSGVQDVVDLGPVTGTLIVSTSGTFSEQDVPSDYQIYGQLQSNVMGKEYGKTH